MLLFWCFYCWLGTYVKPFSNVSIVDFKQVYVSFVKCDRNNCLKWGKLDVQPFQIQFPQTSFKNNSYFIVSFFFTWSVKNALVVLTFRSKSDMVGPDRDLQKWKIIMKMIDNYWFILFYLHLEELSTEDMNKLAATLKTLLPYYEGNRGNWEIWLNYINKWKMNIMPSFWWQLRLYLNKTVQAK